MGYIYPMKLIPNKSATRRTLNRIRENGPHFEDITRQFLGRSNGRVDFEDGRGLRQCVLVRSECGVPAADGWMGWLPIDEIERTTSGGVKFSWPIDENGDFASGGWACLNLQAWRREEELDELRASEHGSSYDEVADSYAADAWHDAHEYPE